MNHQTHIQNLREIGIKNIRYEFMGLPAYEQFSQNEPGFSFSYTLILLDSSGEIITIVIEDGK